MAYSTPALFHRRGRQTRRTDEIADAINMGDSCLAMVVDGQRSFFGDSQACSCEVEFLQICLSPQGHEHFVTGDHLSILECCHHLRDAIPPDVSNRLGPAIAAAFPLKALHERANEFRIEKLQGTISPIDDCDLYTERGKD